MNAQPASATRLRVLLVEDCAADAELTLDALRRAGFDPQSQRVETETEYLAHLAPDLDVILADHTLRQFDAARALELAGARGCHVPLIIVSGTAGEDHAVAAMKKGACDYLLKKRLARLGGSVRLAMEATARRQLRAGADLTERKLLETQLRQAQKMEAIGQLAGGIAHDFNNLLTAILGYAKFAADALAPGDQRRLDVEQVIKAAQRAAGLTKQLLAFSRKQVLRSTLVDLNALVTGVSQMLRLLIGEHIEIEMVLAPDLALVRADAGQLEQVVINLAVNARDAMEQGGRLTLETANLQLGAASGSPGQAVVPGWYVMLAVIDRGVGMDENTKQHLFEPFFTTKDLGKGTGLGLATVHGIIKQSDGYIWVDSVPGRGSSFKVYLPRIERPAEVDASAARPRSPDEGSETVLIVEDEAGVRDQLASQVRTVLDGRLQRVS